MVAPALGLRDMGGGGDDDDVGDSINNDRRAYPQSVKAEI